MPQLITINLIQGYFLISGCLGALKEKIIPERYKQNDRNSLWEIIHLVTGLHDAPSCFVANLSRLIKHGLTQMKI